MCLALCNAVRVHDDETLIETALLRARVHVRLDRGDHALEALCKSSLMALSLDQYVGTQLLTGAAYVRLGEKERGAAILREVLDRAKEASPRVRAELSLQLGIAKFRLGAYDEASRFLADVRPDADITYAQALEYRGWVAQARGQFENAAQRLRESLAELATCRRRDRYVEAKALYGLAALCPELLSTAEWPLIERRLERFDWSASGIVRWRFWTDQAASMMSEMMGDAAGALRWARRAERTAESAGYGVVALCRLAAIFRGLRELNSHAHLIERARETYDALELRHLAADLQSLPLFLAEEIAYTKAPETADALLAQYRQIERPAWKSSSGDMDRYVAMACSIEAALLEARGEVGRAVQAFARSYGVLSALGYRRRAMWIALRLARLTGEHSYLVYAKDSLRGASPAFWMVRELTEIQSGPGPSVTTAEMEVLRLLVQGKTYKEIAAARCASVKTIDNHVQALFRKFQVHSRGELAAAAIRQGIVVLHRPVPDANG